jgi:cytochrome c
MPHLTTPRSSPPGRRLPWLAVPLAALACAGSLISARPAAAAGDSKPSPGRSLAQRHGCLGCHATEAQLVGPSYRAVQERYRDQPAAAAELTRHIRAGGSGRWGQVAMPPQAQLGEADARRLAAWILSGAK